MCKVSKRLKTYLLVLNCYNNYSVLKVFHPCHTCPIQNATCYKCQKGHFYSVCCANKSTAATAETSSPTLVTTGLLDISDGLTKAAMKI